MLKIEWRFKGQTQPEHFFPTEQSLVRKYTNNGAILELVAEDNKLVFAITLADLEYLSMYEFTEDNIIDLSKHD